MSDSVDPVVSVFRPSPFPVVCTSAWTPMVFSDGDDQTQWSGYAIDLYRAVAAKLRYDPSTWVFETMDWDVMEARLDSGNCTIASAGEDITVANIQRGWLTTFPIYTRAFAILTTLDHKRSSIFSFLSPFSLDLWLAFLFTSLLTACLIWIFEVWSHQSAFIAARRQSQARLTPAERKAQMRKHPLPSKTASIIHREAVAEKGWMKGSFEFFYQVLGKVLNIVDTINVRTLASKILLMFWGLGVVVILASYSASLTANLTVSRVSGGVSSLADLPGKAVGTWTPYVDQLKQYNVFSTGYAWNNADDEKVMVRDLLAHKVVAFVLDNVFVRYLAMNSGCKLQEVGTEFQYTDIGITFAPGTNASIVAEFNDALVALKQEGLHETLEKRYFGRDNRCVDTGLSNTGNKITFPDLKGLWVIGAVWYGFAVLIFFAQAVYSYLSVQRQVRAGLSPFTDDTAHVGKEGLMLSDAFDSRPPSVVIPINSGLAHRNQSHVHYGDGGERKSVTPQRSGMTTPLRSAMATTPHQVAAATNRVSNGLVHVAASPASLSAGPVKLPPLPQASTPSAN